MQINIVDTSNLELTDPLRSYAEQKLQKLSTKYVDPNDESAQCDVELSKTTEHHKEGAIYRAEFNVHISGKDLFAASEQEDIYAAVDDAAAKLAKQFTSHRGKRETLLRKGGKKLKQMLRRSR